MPKVLIDGNLVDVPASALFADDGATPFGVPTPPPGQVFTAADIERARQEEKDKLYPQIERNKAELAELTQRVGTLTQAEEERKEELRLEREALDAERRRQEEEGLSAKELIARKEEEWRASLEEVNQNFTGQLAEERGKREASEAMLERERQFQALSQYAQDQVAANSDKIAPQLLPWITGNTQEEIDAAVTRAIETTDAIAADIQGGQQPPVPPNQQIVVEDFSQPQPQQVPPTIPVLPGTRPTGGPGNTDPAAQFQTLSADQIRGMDMQQYAALRSKIGIGGQGQNRGLYG